MLCLCVLPWLASALSFGLNWLFRRSETHCQCNFLNRSIHENKSDLLGVYLIFTLVWSFNPESSSWNKSDIFPSTDNSSPAVFKYLIKHLCPIVLFACMSVKICMYVDMYWGTLNYRQIPCHTDTCSCCNKSCDQFIVVNRPFVAPWQTVIQAWWMSSPFLSYWVPATLSETLPFVIVWLATF